MIKIEVIRVMLGSDEMQHRKPFDVELFLKIRVEAELAPIY